MYEWHWISYLLFIFSLFFDRVQVVWGGCHLGLLLLPVLSVACVPGRRRVPVFGSCQGPDDNGLLKAPYLCGEYVKVTMKKGQLKRVESISLGSPLGGCFLPYLAKGCVISKFLHLRLHTRITEHCSSVCRKWQQQNSCIQKIPLTVNRGRGKKLGLGHRDEGNEVSALTVYGETDQQGESCAITQEELWSRYITTRVLEGRNGFSKNCCGLYVM